MSTTTFEATEESTANNPFEMGVRDGIRYYAPRVVLTDLGRWAVLLSLLTAVLPTGNPEPALPLVAHIGLALVSSFMVLVLVDMGRAAIREQGGDHA